MSLFTADNVKKAQMLEALERSLKESGEIPSTFRLENCLLTVTDLEHGPSSEGHAIPYFLSHGTKLTLRHDARPPTSQIELARMCPADIPQPSIEPGEPIVWVNSRPSQEREPTEWGGISEVESDSSQDTVISNDSVPVMSGPVTTLALRPANPPVVSPATKPRNPHTRADGLTDVCGVYSPDTGRRLVTTISQKGGKNTCPRCFSTMTRSRTVKDHFPGCIAKYGNPRALKYTDHESMQNAEKRRLLDRGMSVDEDSTDNDGDLEMSGVDEAPNTEDWVQGQVDIEKETGASKLADQAAVNEAPRSHWSPVSTPAWKGPGMTPPPSTIRTASPNPSTACMTVVTWNTNSERTPTPCPK